MSDPRTKLDAAIRAYAQEVWDGDLIVDWVLIAATVDEDGEHCIGSETSRENMPRYVTVGLLTEGLMAEDKARE